MAEPPKLLARRTKDVDSARGQITVPDPKWKRDRTTMLPRAIDAELREQLLRARTVHEGDLAQGWGCVWLPDALTRKFLSAPLETRWQWVFPAPSRWPDRASCCVLICDSTIQGCAERQPYLRLVSWVQMRSMHFTEPVTVTTPTGSINFDFGHDGRADGFSPWKLADVAHQLGGSFLRFCGWLKLKEELDLAVAEGSVHRPFLAQQDDLYYLVTTRDYAVAPDANRCFTVLREPRSGRAVRAGEPQAVGRT